MTLTGEMINFSDYLDLMILLFFIVIIAIIALELIAFLPSLMISLVRSIRNKSLQEQTNLLQDTLTPSLDPAKILDPKLESKLEPKIESTINPGQHLRR